MLAKCLHALFRKRPEAFLNVELIPCRAAHFARSCGGENGQFQRQPTEGFLLAQRLHERWHVFMGHGGKVIVTAGLARQSPRYRPHGRFGVAVTRRISPIEDSADLLPHAARRLRLLEPDFLKQVADHRTCDLIDPEFPDVREGIKLKRSGQLRVVSAIAPRLRVNLVNPRCRVLEGRHRLPLAPLELRVDPKLDLATDFARHLALAPS